jgi:hypothetical protein
MARVNIICMPTSPRASYIHYCWNESGATLLQNKIKSLESGSTKREIYGIYLELKLFKFQQKRRIGICFL